MVLGENIGTTITANIAALPANVSAKRAALSHSTFNVFGVIWMLCLFYPFIKFVGFITGKIGPGNPVELTDTDTSTYQIATSYGLSLFHSMFNIINTFVMIWFVKTIARIVSYIIPQKESDEEFSLKHISTGFLSTSEMSLLQARKEIVVYSERTERMFKQVRELYIEQNENSLVKMFSRIEKYENISDRMEVEIAAYLTKVAKGRLSEEGKQAVQGMLRIISEIESVGDGCFNLAKTIMRKHDDKSVYTPDMDANVELMMNLVEQAMEMMKKQLKSTAGVSDEDYNRSENMENEINNFRNELKLKNVDDVKEQKYGYQASVTYMDIIGECEKTGDYIINVVEALNEMESVEG